MKFVACLVMVLAGAAHAAEVLHLYNWNNYIADPTVARFEASCRCRLVRQQYRPVMSE